MQEEEEEESSTEWISQTASIRGSDHRWRASAPGHPHGAHRQITEGGLKVPETGKYRKVFLNNGKPGAAAMASCISGALTTSKAPTAFCRASASVAAAAEPPVMAQAERDRESETQKDEPEVER